MGNVDCILGPLGIFYEYLGYFINLWFILCSFVTFCVHLLHFVIIWYIL
jgi:hypothetical protein